MMLGLINQPEHLSSGSASLSPSRVMSWTSRRRSRRISLMRFTMPCSRAILVRLGGLRVLRIDGEVFVNGEKINSRTVRRWTPWPPI
jgi:50S ribosomal protein L16 3-hydroxylase